LLLCSPTGTGKTLAAFLPILAALGADEWVPGRCLYLAPLKALANDVRKNLRWCLRSLRRSGAEPPSIHIGIRTGDTPARVRRLLSLRPPDILLTTPESLAVMLSQSSAPDKFTGLRCVVVDEVHALAGNKRGADLALSLERLQAVCHAPLQRIGLSATCTPASEAARFLVGVGRPCAVRQVADRAPLKVQIEPLEENNGFMVQLLDRLDRELQENATTLIFANTRGLAERLCWAMYRRWPHWAGRIAVHHSALDASRRQHVERALKRGRLRAVITSTSLELGIDIGTVDLVVLVHPPGGVVRLLQRIGRAGHSPGKPRRGLVLTANSAELLEAAATAAAGRSSQWEPLHIAAGPLDVLCQHLAGMAAGSWWSSDEAFDLVRLAYPYRHLSRTDFDDCLDYLSGRHADGTTWLPPRLRWHKDRFTITDRRTARLLPRNLGTIIAEEPRQVRIILPSADSALSTQHSALLPLGQLDEPYADRLQPGDRFLLDGRCLEVKTNDVDGVVVQEMAGRPAVPRWGGDGGPLSPELADRIYLLRMRAAEALREGRSALADLLCQEYGLASPAARALMAYFERQECASEIPDSRTCLIETVHRDPGWDCYVHTPLNRAGNDALARVAVRRLVRDFGQSAASVVADLGFMLSMAGFAEPGPAVWRTLLDPVDFDADLAQALADSVTLRQRFHQVALIGLMLLRNPIGGRRRVGGVDWAERRLFGQVCSANSDFVLMRQALREVRHEACDAGSARTFLNDLAAWTIRIRPLSRPSPFVESWTQLAAGPVETIDTPAEALLRLHATLTHAKTPA
jgi:ATP-dependent Lhr-like helicase